MLAAPLEIIGGDGAGALSMRRLVAALGSDAGRHMCNSNMARTGSASFEPHLAGQGGAEVDLMELNGWTSPQMLRRYGASARSAWERRTYDRIMESP